MALESRKIFLKTIPVDVKLGKNESPFLLVFSEVEDIFVRLFQTKSFNI